MSDFPVPATKLTPEEAVRELRALRARIPDFVLMPPAH